MFPHFARFVERETLHPARHTDDHRDSFIVLEIANHEVKPSTTTA